ncbi:MAG: high-potential iron-sulfur protein [Gammaproteobacteria bacterium]
MANQNRRKFIAGCAVIPLASLTASRIAFAADKIDEGDPAAAALGYKHDASAVDTAKFPKQTGEQNCANCQLYTGAEGSEWGPCGIFPGKDVSASGWCNAWVAKA